MNLNEHLQQAYQAGRWQGLTEQGFIPRLFRGIKGAIRGTPPGAVDDVADVVDIPPIKPRLPGLAPGAPGAPLFSKAVAAFQDEFLRMIQLMDRIFAGDSQFAVQFMEVLQEFLNNPNFSTLEELNEFLAISFNLEVVPGPDGYMQIVDLTLDGLGDFSQTSWNSDLAGILGGIFDQISISNDIPLIFPSPLTNPPPPFGV